MTDLKLETKESLYKVGDLVQKSWLKGKGFPPGEVVDVAIATRFPDKEIFVYEVQFKTCKGNFLESDLTPIDDEILEGTADA